MSSLFITHYSPVYAAHDLSDQLLMPLGLNVVELLCSASYNHLNSKNYNELGHILLKPPYKRTDWQNKNAFALWIGEDKSHYLWALKYLTSILGELAHRFPHRNLPKYSQHVDYFHSFAEQLDTKKYNVSLGIKAADLSYPLHTSKNVSQDFVKYGESDVRLLHRYILFERYMYKYVRLHTWTNRTIPVWVFDPFLRECCRNENGNPTTKLAKHLKFYTPELV